MVSLLHPLQLSTVTIFIICISFHTSDGKHGDNYKDCSSLVSCGNVTNIGYPFWGAGRPLNCGHPALQILCLRNGSNDYPTINITLQELGIQHEYGDETLSHRMLDYQKKSNHDIMSITIKLQKLILHNTCFLSFNITGPDEINLFEYSADFQNISLVYGKDCFDQKMLAGHPSFRCSDNKNNSITIYYLQNQTVWGHNRSKQSCELIQYPVPPGKELDDLRSGDYKALFNVLNQEFEVDYSRNYSDLCFKCEDSGGVCGSLPYSEFACHCKNSGPQLYRCPKGKLKLILGLAIPGGILMFIVLNVALCYWKKPKFHSPNSLSRLILSDPVNSDHEINWSIYGIPVFSYDELQEATNNFDQTQELGDGGFGVVYYGKLRDGREVAVKRLYERNFKRVGQLLNEVEILTKLRHKNLVTLYGCTSSHSRENLLVYEYIPNGTVADHLYGEKSVSKALSWTVRMKIAIETATALSYLHASDIIHRDVKTNNILLDNNFLVKVADFGLSRLFPLDATHVSTAPQGTPGYLDPEYHKCYQVTSKSDVYSFGVVLIELISSLPPIDVSRNESEINLSDFAMKRIQKGDLDKLVDQKLGFETDFKVKRMTTLVAELAFQCLQQEREVRPSMEEVLECLKQIESADYEVIEAEETTRNVGGRNPDSANDVDQALRTTQQPRSPSSVFETWVSSSTATNPSS